MMNSKNLEAQCQVKIDRWIDIKSPEFKEMDQYPDFTKMILNIVESPKTGDKIFTDELGRIWGAGECGVFYPLHDEFCGEKIGYRLVKKAAN